ncbi:MAG: hypothetical protein Q9212_005410 [Teloschistes hypoglaucus]
MEIWVIVVATTGTMFPTGREDYNKYKKDECPAPKNECTRAKKIQMRKNVRENQGRGETEDVSDAFIIALKFSSEMGVYSQGDRVV